MFQIGVVTPETIETVQSASAPWVALVIGLIVTYVVVFLILLVVRHFLHRQHREIRGLRKVVLQITVPKESSEANSQNKNYSNQEIREKINSAESMFASLGGLKAEKGIKTWFIGRDDEVSFEIVVHEGLVRFYIALPPKMQDLVEEQIHANYPHAEIEEIDDYNIFTPTGATAGAYLVFKRENYFPIKTYQKLEIDPLSNITNALATIPHPDGAAIQVIVRSAPAV